MSDLVKNEIYTAEITGYGSDGSGVARIAGRAVFVPRAIVGETWRIVITKATASAVYGRALEPVSLSPGRREPDCPYYPRCGGCALRHMSYAEQLRFKLGKVNDALEHIGGQSVRAERIIASERTERCRNKGIYAVRSRGGRAQTGFFAPRSHELVAVDSCLLQTELADSCARAVADFMNENGVPAYDEQSRRGAVRHVFVRKAVNTSDAVAVIVAARGFGARTEPFVRYLRGRCPELTGIVLNVNKTVGNTILAGDFYTLWGSDKIYDSLGGFEYELSPQTFYQVNPPQAEKLYELAASLASPERDSGTVLDMYCGAGTISLFLAKRAKQVIGTEIVPQAVQNARENAARNGVANARFICADASEAARMLLEEGETPDAVVVDPPRRGMDAAAIAAICGMGPERVVYVSCNPATLARDVRTFSERGYALETVTALDMFPHTASVETVVLLSRETNPLMVEVRMEVETGEVKEHPTYKRIQEYVQEKYGFKVHTAYIAEVKRMVGLDMHKAPNAVEQRKHEYHPCPPEKVEAIKDALRHFGLISE